jgi:hypothetical protein
LAAAQERFLAAILPHAAKKLHDLMLRYLRSSSVAKRHFGDLAKDAHAQLVLDFRSELQRTCDSVVQVFTQNLKAVHDSNVKRLTVHRAWQRTLTLISLSLLASTMVWTYGHRVAGSTEVELANLRSALAGREADFQAAEAKRQRLQNLVDTVRLTSRPDGSVWGICDGPDGVQRLYRLRDPVQQ